jgi:nitrogen fixation-related uncharacterized protein
MPFVLAIALLLVLLLFIFWSNRKTSLENLARKAHEILDDKHCSPQAAESVEAVLNVFDLRSESTAFQLETIREALIKIEEESIRPLERRALIDFFDIAYRILKRAERDAGPA